ncbi:MAG TPA: hypothetical protein VFQ23_08095 [Anaerolineales bacterium]|nr:hypothetical protein [Anaerolineales bacterium]
MKHELIEELRQRNSRIIEAIIKKEHAVCPGSIALIGIAGSFCHGDIHERSDLDLCIVINDNDGWKIADCFILNDVGFDVCAGILMTFFTLSAAFSPTVRNGIE